MKCARTPDCDRAAVYVADGVPSCWQCVHDRPADNVRLNVRHEREVLQTLKELYDQLGLGK